jgi:threonylcarbamoyladenosine tRNA methylthiotransferase MtaB
LAKQDWVRLSHLVSRIAALPGDFRVRLSSIEATEVTRELVDVLTDGGDRVCPHLHISMQSGSDTVLARMRRRWGSRRFIDRCQLLKELLDRPAITTDIIVGFPGETDAEFAETIETSRAVGFSKIHIFPFSPRRGTPAATMPNQVPAHVQQERSRELAAVEAEMRDEYFNSLRGMRLRVLVESKGEAGWIGTACRYAPVELQAHDSMAGQLIDIVAGERRDGRLVGTLA